jgi:hypothetical protein
MLSFFNQFAFKFKFKIVLTGRRVALWDTERNSLVVIEEEKTREELPETLTIINGNI